MTSLHEAQTSSKATEIIVGKPLGNSYISKKQFEY
jgi:hypothetical protein